MSEFASRYFSGYSFARIIIFCIFAPKKGVFKQ